MITLLPGMTRPNEKTAAHANATAVHISINATTLVAHNSEECKSFLQRYLAPSGISLTAITPDAFDPKFATSTQWFGADAMAAAEWARAENAKSRNVYWTSNIVTPGLNRKPKKSDIASVRIAHVDIDPPKQGVWDKQGALADLIARGSPSLIIDSGGGLQAVWWLSESTTHDQIEQINIGIADRFGGDHCFNVDRLLRLPGSINWPDQRKQALGRVPVKASLVVPFTGHTFRPTDLATAFPTTRDVAALTEELPDGPCEGYTGPSDDEDLIRMMLAARGSIKAALGTKASLTELWNGDTSKFDGDHSRADSALMSHLAFWTGKDSARMARLFERSKLMRDKWRDRPDYRQITIRKAVRDCPLIYNRERPEPVVTDSPVMLVTGMMEHPETVADWVSRSFGFVSKLGNRGIVPLPVTGMTSGMSEATFRREIQLRTGLSKGEATGQMESFFVNPKTVWGSSLQLRPDQPEGVFTEDGARHLNMWRKPRHPHAPPGFDVSLFVSEFLPHLIPDKAQREWFIQWLAWKWQHPESRGVAVLMVAAAEFGTGRGTLMKFIDALYGGNFVRTLRWETLTGEGSQGQFNAWNAESIFVFVEEIGKKEGARRFEENKMTFEKLKTVVDTTTEWADVNVKGVSPFRARIFYSTLCATNNKDAIALPSNDRRFTVLENGEVLPKTLRARLNAARLDPIFIAALAEWLDGIDTSGFDPFEPLHTSIKDEMTSAFESPLSERVAAIIENFSADLFTPQQVAARVRLAMPNSNFTDNVITSEIARRHTRIRGRGRDGDKRIHYTEYGKDFRLAVYAKNRDAANKWASKDNKWLNEELIKIGPPAGKDMI
ncbi:DUF5906 domain-containing protein [Corticibacterium sp. UT-5YL-CI-8]|nr:DUF5906 domain-containing protein [Tianweitania sp. UT-5YL-CI-8]